MVRTLSHRSPRARRALKVSALAAALTVAIGQLHAQSVSVEATSDVILGRAPTVTISGVTNESVPGQPPATGDVLRVDAAASDPDNDAITATSYRWLRGATEVGTGASYTATAADAGQTLSVEVTATTDPAITEPSTNTSSTTVEVANRAPTANPTITYEGELTVGTVLNANSGYNDAEGDAQSGTTYQWCQYTADGATMQGCAAPSTSNEWTVIAGNVGRRLGVKVIPKSSTGTPSVGDEAVSAMTPIIDGRPPVATAASVTVDGGGAMKNGAVLRANYTYSDADNDVQSGTAFQWYRKSGSTITDIGSATSATYTLTAADQGDHFIGVKITPKSGTGNPNTGETVTADSASKFQGTAPTANPTITYNGETVGAVLIANAGYADADNDPQSGTTYQWCQYSSDGATLQGCAAPSTSNEWTVVAGNVGRRLGVKVIPKSATGTPSIGDEVASATTPIIDGRPPFASAASVTVDGGGTMKNGAVLRANYTYTDADNDLQSGTTFQWYRKNGSTITDIGSATSATYTLTAADQGDHFIGVRITPKSGTGNPNTGTTVTADSASKYAGTKPSVTVSITGTPTVGQGLTGNIVYADADNDAAGTHDIKWYRADNATGTTNRVQVATMTNYTLQLADAGKYLVFEVVPKAATGAQTTGDTKSVVTVQVPYPDLPTGASPSITGVLDHGETLSASFAYSNGGVGAGTGPGAHEYKWYRADNTAGTSGKTLLQSGTSNQYTQVSADQGKYIIVEITPTSANGTSGTMLSTGSAKELRYRVSNDTLSWSNMFGDLLIPIAITNRSGNAPANLKVGVWRDGLMPMELLAPDGTVYSLNAGEAGSPSFTTVNASAETGNGTWTLRVRDNDFYQLNGPSGIVIHFTLEFTP